MEQVSILFVDDEVNILRSLQRLFIDEPYDIHTAESGREALDLVDSGLEPAVIISDQRMPGMNGAEFLAKVKEKRPESIGIVLTGYADVNAAVDAINVGGVYRYILKPWEDDDLKLAIKEAADRFKLIDQNKRLTEELRIANKKLEQLNVNLEDKVTERTHALQDSYEKNLQLTKDLQNTIKELQGWDRIQKHLLTINTLEETLEVVLDIMVTVTDVQNLRIFLKNKDDSSLYLAASSDEKEQKDCQANEEKIELDGEKENLYKQLLNLFEPHILSSEEAKIAQYDKPSHMAIVPILKGKGHLGLIELADERSGAINKQTLHIIFNFGMQAAIAIQDSRMDFVLPELENAIDEVLTDLNG